MKVIDQTLDANGMHTPMPLLTTLHAMDEMHDGDVLMLVTAEPRASQSVAAFCRESGNVLMEEVDWEDEFTFLIRKT